MQLEGTSRRLPVYFLLDTSGSMSGTGIQAVNAGLRDFESAIKSDPHALESAYVSVITFDDDARQVASLTEAGAFSAPTLSASGRTALGRAFTVLGQCVDREVRDKDATHPGDWLPIVFLMTDGEPTDEWRAALEAFKQRKTRRVGEIIAVGCGTDVNDATLKQITERVYRMPELSADKIKAFFVWVSRMTTRASQAAGQQGTPAGSASAIQTPPPPGIFQVAT
jgi:uncharacterized protein YegL